MDVRPVWRAALGCPASLRSLGSGFRIINSDLGGAMGIRTPDLLHAMQVRRPSCQRHPTFIRYPRGPAEGVIIKDQPRLIEIGKAEVIQNFKNNGGRKVALFPLGNMMPLGRQAAVQLAAEGYDVAIVNPRFVKPLDSGATEFFGRSADVMVTLEDHVLMGGYGSAVLELFNEKRIS